MAKSRREERMRAVPRVCVNQYSRPCAARSKARGKNRWDFRGERSQVRRGGGALSVLLRTSTVVVGTGDHTALALMSTRNLVVLEHGATDRKTR